MTQPTTAHDIHRAIADMHGGAEEANKTPLTVYEAAVKYANEYELDVTVPGHDRNTILTVVDALNHVVDGRYSVVAWHGVQADLEQT